MSDDRLTAREDWDRYWSGLELPAEVRRETATPYVRRILDVLDHYLPRDPRLSALEIGGAPGQYLAYLHRRFGYSCHCLDYSPVGCEQTRRNFELLGIPLTLHQVDLFADELDVGSFDVVFSLGLIEHFDDLRAVVGRHADLVSAGGTLVLGCPNFRGVTRLFMERLSPALLSEHNLESMDVRRWDGFERELRLERLFRGYVGGFEPSLLRAREAPRTASRHALNAIAYRLDTVLRHHFAFLRRWNTRWTSGYVMGVYRVPA